MKRITLWTQTLLSSLKCKYVLLSSSFLLLVAVHYVNLFITRNTRISFRKAHLQKAICYIFTCEKSLYSQSEWRVDVFTCGRLTNQRQRKGLCQPIKIVHRLHSNSVSDFGGYFISPSFKFSCQGRGKLQICVSWLLPRLVCMASRKEEHIEQITERCLIAQKKFRFKERAERD